MEGHFNELRGQVLALLERREAILLSQLDQQVELKQEMLQEQREEVAIAFSKVMACQEEGEYKLTIYHICGTIEGRKICEFCVKLAECEILILRKKQWLKETMYST